MILSVRHVCVTRADLLTAQPQQNTNVEPVSSVISVCVCVCVCVCVFPGGVFDLLTVMM